MPIPLFFAIGILVFLLGQFSAIYEMKKASHRIFNEHLCPTCKHNLEALRLQKGL